jgi:acetyl esterase/lipase
MLWILVVAALAGATAGEAVTPGDAIPLWPGEPPYAAGSGEGHIPNITPHFPPADRNSGTAVVVCPGGGYHGLALDHEGDQVARWLVGEGISAFILRYRHAPDYQHPVPLTDAQRAIRLVRSHAAEWGIDPARIGILGFSAGGHLTASAGVHFTPGDEQSPDAVERLSSRPDFLVLVYPVISMDGPYTHRGSRTNLLGADPDPALVQKMSLDQQVTADTPPTFLVHTSGDTGVPAENSVLFYLGLRKAGVPAEMHVYEKGEHGFGLAPKDPILSTWPKHCIDWLRGRGLLK